MKPIYGCICLGVIVLVAVPVSAQRLPVGIGASEHHGVRQDGFEQRRFLYKVGESSLPDYGEMHDRDITPPFQRGPFQGRQHKPFGDDGNNDLNSSNTETDQTITPSADVPDSVHGYSGNRKTWPGAKRGLEGDPSVRDLSGSDLSESGGPSGVLGR